MTTEQVKLAVRKYNKRLEESGYTSWFYPLDRVPNTDIDALKHAKWMCMEVERIADEDVEKAMRWLGFIRAILWQCQIYTIDQMGEDNKPEKIND